MGAHVRTFVRACARLRASACACPLTFSPGCIPFNSRTGLHIHRTAHARTRLAPNRHGTHTRAHTHAHNRERAHTHGTAHTRAHTRAHTHRTVGESLVSVRSRAGPTSTPFTTFSRLSRPWVCCPWPLPLPLPLLLTLALSLVLALPLSRPLSRPLPRPPALPLPLQQLYPPPFCRLWGNSAEDHDWPPHGNVHTHTCTHTLVHTQQNCQNACRRLWRHRPKDHDWPPHGNVLHPPRNQCYWVIPLNLQPRPQP